jgi:hypothetical protein
MNNVDSLEEQAIATVTNWCGLALAGDRVRELIPAARRLKQAGQWLSKLDLDAAEPACVFDPRITE